jgi:copper transport protein
MSERRRVTCFLSGRRLAGIAIMLWAMAWTTQAAFAHAVLLESNPADGAILDRAPARIELRFNEAVTPVFLRVVGPDGRPVLLGDTPVVVDRLLRMALPAQDRPGAYLVSWRVISADAHPIGGAVVFTVGPAAPAPVDRSDSQGEALWKGAVVINRAIGDVALLFAAGGVLCIVLVFDRRIPGKLPIGRPILIAATIAIVASALAVGLAGGWLAAAPAAAIFDALPWQAGAATAAAARAAGSIGGMVAVMVGMRALHRRYGLVLAVGGALAAAASVALSGHVAALSPAWPARFALALHAITAAFWLGSLWPLHLASRHLPLREAARLLRRFSTVAVPAVGLLIVAGAGVALTRVTSMDDLLQTRYGVVLTVKLACVALMLMMAARNHWISRRLSPANSKLRAALLRNIRIEIGLAAVILAATALLAHTPPGRTIGAQDHDSHADQVADLSIRDERRGHLLRLDVLALHHGAYRIVATLADGAGKPLPAREVTVELSKPDAAIEPLSRVLAPQGARFILDRVDLPLAGRWQVRIDALVSDFEKITFTAAIAIP